MNPNAFTEYLQERYQFYFLTDEVDWGFGEKRPDEIGVMVTVAKSMNIELRFYKMITARNRTTKEMETIVSDNVNLFVYPFKMTSEEKEEFIKKVDNGLKFVNRINSALGIRKEENGKNED